VGNELEAVVDDQRDPAEAQTSQKRQQRGGFDRVVRVSGMELVQSGARDL
jgi:hypothetical protein